MASTMLRKPHRRVCERCNRLERWDDDRGSWRIVERDGEKLVGDPHCLHEWDINGTFRPFD